MTILMKLDHRSSDGYDDDDEWIWLRVLPHTPWYLFEECDGIMMDQEGSWPISGHTCQSWMYEDVCECASV